MKIRRPLPPLFVFFAALLLLGGVGSLTFFFIERFVILNSRLKQADKQGTILTQGLGDLDAKRKKLETDQLTFAARVADQEARLKLLEDERKSLLTAIQRISGQNRALSEKAEEAETVRSAFEKLEQEYREESETAAGLAAEKKELKAKIKGFTGRLKKAEGSQKKQYKRAAAEIKKEYEGKIKGLQTELENLRELSQEAATLAGERDRLQEEIFQLKTAYYYNLGVVYTRYGLFRAAARMYEQALALNPDDAAAHHNLGILYEVHLGRRKEAVEHYQRFLELEPDEKQQGKVRRWIEESKHGVGSSRRTSIESSRQTFERYFLPKV